MVTLLIKLAVISRFAIFSIIDYLAISKRAKINAKTLLMVRVDCIGDYILSRNSIKAIKKSEKYKDYRIILCGNIVWKELAETLDREFIDEFIWINLKKFCWNVYYRCKTLRAISKRGFEAAIQPTFSRTFYEGDAIIRASHAKERIGSQGDYSNIAPWKKRLSDRWYTYLVPASAEPMNEILRNAEFVRNLGLTAVYAQLPVIKVSGAIRNEIKENEYYILFPSAGRAERCWPAESFAELAEKIYTATGWTGIICGGKNDEELGQRLKKLSHAPLHNMAGKTSLAELLNIIAKARLVVTNETGLMHLAVAIGAPVMCILGGGHFGRFVPYPAELEPTQKPLMAVMHKMPCFNCGWNCIYKTARGVPFLCIKNISVEDVWSRLKTLIEHKNTKQGLN